MGLFTHAPTGLVPEHARPGRRVRSPDTWASARDDYAAGLSAPDVCDRHDLGISAFRKRAREEGWRRADQTDPLPPPPEDPDQPPPAPEALAEAAYRALSRAVLAGDVRGARSWAFILRDLRRMTPDPVVEPPPPPRASPQRAPTPPSRATPAEAVEPVLATSTTPDAPTAPTPAARTPSSADSVAGDPEPSGDAPAEVHSVHAIHPVSSAMSPNNSGDLAPRRRNRFGLARHYVPPP